jgi:pimeloyl-ACP methyl ester carboxylesterase
MPRTLALRLPFALLLIASVLWLVAAPVGAAPGVNALVGTPVRSVFIRPPQGLVPGKPVQVLLVLHGMGNNGEDFSRDLFGQADRYGWMIVAPTIDYGDWTKPEVVAHEDPLLIRALSEYLDQLPQQTGMKLRHSILILGHSRGAQLAHRFAEFRPDRVLAVAALAAGSYTLPVTSSTRGSVMFPYGVKDLARYGGRAFDAQAFEDVRFWVGVGGLDTNPNDVPRQWDALEGTTRVQRAQAFEAGLRALGVPAVLKVFGSARHEVTSEMRSEACMFLGDAMLPRLPYGSPIYGGPVSY